MNAKIYGDGEVIHQENMSDTPLFPTFIKQNWDMEGVYLFLLFLLQNIDCGYS